MNGASLKSFSGLIPRFEHIRRLHVICCMCVIVWVTVSNTVRCRYQRTERKSGNNQQRRVEDEEWMESGSREYRNWRHCLQSIVSQTWKSFYHCCELSKTALSSYFDDKLIFVRESLKSSQSISFTTDTIA